MKKYDALDYDDDAKQIDMSHGFIVTSRKKFPPI